MFAGTCIAMTAGAILVAVLGIYRAEQPQGEAIASRGSCREIQSYTLDRCETDEVVCYVAGSRSNTAGRHLDCRWKEVAP